MYLCLINVGGLTVDSTSYLTVNDHCVTRVNKMVIFMQLPGDPKCCHCLFDMLVIGVI